MSNSTDNRYMEFCLGTQLYAIPLLTVKEVISKPEVTMVPNMPPHFEGMFNLRGQILAVFSIRKKIAAKAQEKSNSNGDVVIVIEQDGTIAGMIVDEVTRVLHADANMIKTAPLKEDDPARKFIEAVIQTEDELVPIINVAKLLELEKYKTALKTA